MRKTVCLLVLTALILGSCRTVEYIDRVRVEYQTRTVTDSTFIDCTDSVFFWLAGDTVRIKEKVTRIEYRYRLLTDTLIKCDTLTIYKQTGISAENAKKPLRWLKIGFIFGIIIIFALYLTIKNLRR